MKYAVCCLFLLAIGVGFYSCDDGDNPIANHPVGKALTEGDDSTPLIITWDCDTSVDPDWTIFYGDQLRFFIEGSTVTFTQYVSNTLRVEYESLETSNNGRVVSIFRVSDGDCGLYSDALTDLMADVLIYKGEVWWRHRGSSDSRYKLSQNGEMYVIADLDGGLRHRDFYSLHNRNEPRPVGLTQIGGGAYYLPINMRDDFELVSPISSLTEPLSPAESSSSQGGSQGDGADGSQGGSPETLDTGENSSNPVNNLILTSLKKKEEETGKAGGEGGNNEGDEELNYAPILSYTTSFLSSSRLALCMKTYCSDSICQSEATWLTARRKTCARMYSTVTQYERDKHDSCVNDPTRAAHYQPCGGYVYRDCGCGDWSTSLTETIECGEGFSPDSEVNGGMRQKVTETRVCENNATIPIGSRCRTERVLYKGRCKKDEDDSPS